MEDRQPKQQPSQQQKQSHQQEQEEQQPQQQQEQKQGQEEQQLQQEEQQQQQQQQQFSFSIIIDHSYTHFSVLSLMHTVISCEIIFYFQGLHNSSFAQVRSHMEHRDWPAGTGILAPWEVRGLRFS